MVKQTFDLESPRAHRVPSSSLRRRHRCDVARWALKHGYPLSRDALAVITGTRQVNTDGSLSTVWTFDTVGQLVAWRYQAWCDTHRVVTPHGLNESLGTYIRYLVANRLLAQGSESGEDLLDYLSDITVDGDGQRSPHGSLERSRVEHPTGLIIQMPKKSNIVARPS